MASKTSQSDKGCRIRIRRLSPAKDFTACLAQDIKEGLSSRNFPLWLPPKYRYDEEGSRLFEEITHTPEYYLTRVETELLKEHADEIMAQAKPDELVELGSGSSTKTRILIEAMRRTGCKRYAPLDISESALREAAETLTVDYDWLQVEGMIGDYDLDLPKMEIRGHHRLIAFLGNTIGNYRSKERNRFIRNIGATMRTGDSLLLGLDLLREVTDHLQTYNYSKRLNDGFNFRQFAVVNKELGANFSIADFECACHWDAENKAVASLLEAQCTVEVFVKAIPLALQLDKGDKLQVGISCKFTRDQISKELSAAGLKICLWYTDSSQRFGVVLACVKE